MKDKAEKSRAMNKKSERTQKNEAAYTEQEVAGCQDWSPAQRD